MAARDCDFLIIGAGIAGASAGYFLSRHGTVALLERESAPGYHTTGRSAAFYAPSYGGTSIRPLTIASGPFLRQPPEGFSDTKPLSERRALYIARQDQVAELDAFEAALRVLEPDIVRLGPAQARALCPVLREDYVASALLEPECSDLDVNAVHQGFLRGLRQRGGTVVTDATAQSITRVGGQWSVETPSGTWRAPVLVNAAGAWADQVAQLAGLRPIGMRPLRRTIIILPPPPLFSPHWPVVLDIGDQFYFKPESGRILASPADETPSDPVDAQPEELDIAIAIDRIQQAADIPVRHVDNKWAGLRTFSPDRTPVVGFDGSAPGFFWFVGQGGYGIQTAPMMGRLAESLIIDRNMPEELAGFDVSAATYDPDRFR
ncbi:FAD-binding oxidoreductase [Emcibacter sp. SYSU 3D8]|uniref:NAD(P)/FAD-dependent oxidoreductase n=1 Tax=Emcibacter sp. SYSU 3D8 TaxID=3133969 RepID=UPI0031FE4F7D